MNKEEFQLNNGKYRIHGTKYIPDNPKNIPIIMSHGFLSNSKKLKRYAMFLAGMGYTVYAYDFCGGHLFGKSEGPREYLTIENELNDLQTVINSVEESKQELMLFGESLGGFISLIYAARNPAVVARVLSIYPALSIPDDARRGKMLFISFDPNHVRETWKCKFGFKFNPSFAEECMRLDTDKIIKEVLCPVCIVHGGKDKIVSATHLRKTLENLSPDSFVYFIKKAGHGFKRKEQDIALAHFKDFLTDKRRG
jgi:alpha-beta hydrolase superfamily lysophospholipase